MGRSRIRIKVRRRKVASQAAFSRQFDVKNHLRKLGNPHSIEFKYDKESTPIQAIVQRGKTYVNQGFGTIRLPGGMEIKQHGYYLEVSDKPDKLGMRFHIPDHSWEPQEHKQPESLRKKYKKKYYNKGTHTIRKIIEHPSTFPVFICKKMNKVEYMEKLVEHKTAKWERKNPKPMDMFTEDVERWKQERETAIERIRDFVVSVYDKLLLTGRFKNKTTGSTDTYQEEKIAELKDINGEGHRINELPKSSKLLKKAQKVVDDTKAKRVNLVAGNLRDHKKQRGRIILPKAA